MYAIEPSKYLPILCNTEGTLRATLTRIEMRNSKFNQLTRVRLTILMFISSNPTHDFPNSLNSKEMPHLIIHMFDLLLVSYTHALWGSCSLLQVLDETVEQITDFRFLANPERKDLEWKTRSFKRREVSKLKYTPFIVFSVLTVCVLQNLVEFVVQSTNIVQNVALDLEGSNLELKWYNLRSCRHGNGGIEKNDFNLNGFLFVGNAIANGQIIPIVFQDLEQLLEDFDRSILKRGMWWK